MALGIGTWCLVLGTWYLVLGTWYLVLGYWTKLRVPFPHRFHLGVESVRHLIGVVKEVASPVSQRKAAGFDITMENVDLVPLSNDLA